MQYTTCLVERPRESSRRSRNVPGAAYPSDTVPIIGACLCAWSWTGFRSGCKAVAVPGAGDQFLPTDELRWTHAQCDSNVTRVHRNLQGTAGGPKQTDSFWLVWLNR